MADDTKKTQDTSTSDVANKEEIKDGGKLLSQEEVNKLVGETRVTEREKTKKEYEELMSKTIQEYEERVHKEREEAERLAKLTAEEKEKEILSKQAEDNKKKETELKLWENKLKATKTLDEMGIPIEMVDFVVSTDDTLMAKNIDSLKESFERSVEKRVAERLDGSTKKDVGISNTSQKTISRMI